MRPAPAGPGAENAARGRIGPNAVLQLVPALEAAGAGALTPDLFAAAGARDWLATPPAGMLDERRVAALHRSLRVRLRAPVAAAVLADAGRRTGDYILAHRIPPLVRLLLRGLPRRLAARTLISAIRAHAWTFVGSGRLSARGGVPAVLEIAANPLAGLPGEAACGCVWHAAAFERLFRELVSPAIRVRETSCLAWGGDACRFEVQRCRLAEAARSPGAKRPA